MRRALLSVHDKRGIVELARVLVEQNVEIISTGGTARLLRENGIGLREISEVTGQPEMLDGRVKTLHPAIHGGILARRDDPKHSQELKQAGIIPIDLVVVNLYPFVETAARPEASPAELVEEIDIGGPTMIRAAAKNFASVAVVVSPDDYDRVAKELRGRGGLSLATRLELARKAFHLTSGYDTAIAGTLAEIEAQEDGLRRLPQAGFPSTLLLSARKVSDLRYGENPHQRAALYRHGAGSTGIAGARQLQGKELSYNNLLDLDAAWGLAGEFDQPVAVIVKHNNPCGVAVAAQQAEAYENALACDPVSAFGSALGFNRPLTAAVAERISQNFVEAIAAPGYKPAALEILAKKKNLRLVEVRAGAEDCGRVRSIAGGLLVQDNDRAELVPAQLRTVTERAPTAAELEALLFAWRVVKHVKSNAIVFAGAGQTVGIGAGQMSRVDSVKLAAQKAVLPLQGTVVASDAFFPFPDGVEEAARAGATAVIQPGGSKRDSEVIAAANRLGLAMVLTGRRHFRH